ncbi:MAG TPA: SpoIIE family protein phosphatase [Anaerohalosphaeraceae bacterium]|nr:SpoIIE family protein phosphatase [Phycisphaerae bacterium]HOK95315.1 SpoIIE family protein phosphatase [Anaerohalosphaeraceae bacterium]HOL32484.1 SpoIIE family protein phosphatase [Anaerohalosphaeraceae bacterium]HOM76156.1 SpoIIE family protein phosphatase [Anaerohalosphaeraceae bacterium]HPC65044.1 SpoIIE family protein phosphatase [Anaerohalosphaeraceae bacterium]
MNELEKKQDLIEEQIYRISTLVAGNFELQTVLDRLAEAAVKITNTTACSIRLLDEEEGDLKMRSTYGLSEQYRNKGPVTKDDPVVKQAFQGQAVVIDDMRIDDRIIYREATLAEGLISQLTVAMVFKDQPIGVLRLYSPEPARFDRDAIRVARLVAAQCAIAITNAKLYAQAIEGAKMAEQMRLAAVIQRRMIPQKAPCMCGLDIAAVYKPCYQIGGDLYDFLQVGQKSLVVGISDVIGKGVPAAIMMSMFRGTLRAYADGGYGRHSMEEIIHKLNRVACNECRDGEFITLFIARIDIDDNTLTYCNCGHEPALLIRGDKISELEEGGLVLGILPDAHYITRTIPFEQGDMLLMYTDGLIDAMNFDGQNWGKERLLAALPQCPRSTAEQFIGSLLGYRRRFVGLANQTDDTSIVAIRRDNSVNTHGQPCSCSQV